MGVPARGVVSDGAGGCAVRDMVIADPGPGEVVVRLHASGVCHTDLDLRRVRAPLVLGHEGAGTVAIVGPDVDLELDAPVVLNWAIPCGGCFQCVAGNRHLCERHSPMLSGDGGAARRGSTLVDGHVVGRAFHLGTMATHTIVRQEAVTPIGDDIPFPSAAIVGCGVMTGYGSVVNAARVEAGSSVVVLGCGGVGLNVVQGARISGAARIIAVDLGEQRRAMASQLGATDVLAPAPGDDDLTALAVVVRGMTDGRGADYAFECTANPALGAAPLAMVRHGGTAVQVSGIEQPLTIDMRLFEWDKTYLNPLYGQCRPERDLPRLFDLYRRGVLLLDELVTRTYPLDGFEQAFDDLLAGRNAKGVLVLT
jgi:Zn-dependent alcohol dehydrogenase